MAFYLTEAVIQQMPPSLEKSEMFVMMALAHLLYDPDEKTLQGGAKAGGGASKKGKKAHTPFEYTVSKQRLTMITHYSKKSVRDALTALEKKGLIKKVRMSYAGITIRLQLPQGYNLTKIKENFGKIICGQDWTGLEVETEPNLVGEEDPLARKLMGGIMAANSAEEAQALSEGGTSLPQGGTPLPRGGTPLPQGGTPLPQGGTPLPRGGTPLPPNKNNNTKIKNKTIPTRGVVGDGAYMDDESGDADSRDVAGMDADSGGADSRDVAVMDVEYFQRIVEATTAEAREKLLKDLFLQYYRQYCADMRAAPKIADGAARNEDLAALWERYKKEYFSMPDQYEYFLVQIVALFALSGPLQKNQGTIKSPSRYMDAAFGNIRKKGKDGVDRGFWRRYEAYKEKCWEGVSAPDYTNGPVNY